ncbi:uncharacterized protein LOC119628557 [Bombyx mori]|uniref:Cuticle protein n=1 Tax=Bombyx mori TaxID=7091 RepID=A0A8R2QXB6_BOMMO|nr:uncharacterized protein LOC119628557 [Bombyx mori]
MKILSIILLFVCIVEGALDEEKGEVEARGKAKYALLIHFFYVAATKLFVLKVVYGILFYVLLSKLWHFGLWFIHYLKEKKHHHVEYIEHDHEPFHGHYDHGPSQYDPVPYAYDKYAVVNSGYTKMNGHEKYGSLGIYKSGVYDSDGSYSVKSR